MLRNENLKTPENFLGSAGFARAPQKILRFYFMSISNCAEVKRLWTCDRPRTDGKDKVRTAGAEVSVADGRAGWVLGPSE